ncbi:hypothetical protein TNCV_1305141 [Trichonephila clavipes]|nr:hypothetical protein TNCV_1305141 [Trichonephila clavipes]
MFDPSSFAKPTPLAHADTSRDVLPRGGTSQRLTNRAIWKALNLRKLYVLFRKLNGRMRRGPILLKNAYYLSSSVSCAMNGCNNSVTHTSEFTVLLKKMELTIRWDETAHQTPSRVHVESSQRVP